MRRFENPVRVFRIGDDLVSPFYLEVAGGLFEEWGSGEVVHVQLGLWWHFSEGI